MTGRYKELDSLRGLAALSVFFGHLYLSTNETLISKVLFKYGPLRVLTAGSEAVMLFFVLSGFVLSLPFYSGLYQNYQSYAIKRICRIYIPYIAAIIIAFIAKAMFYTGTVAGLTHWFNVNWATSLTINSVIDHILLIGTFTSNLNNVVWSLVHEMRISLVFPFIIFFLNRFDSKKGIFLGVVLSAATVTYNFIIGRSFWGTEWYVTANYTGMFIIGALLAKNREKIKNKLLTLSLRGNYLLFIIGIILYLYAHPSFMLNQVIPGLNPFYRMVVDSWFTALGAGIIIIFAVSSGRFSKILNNEYVNYFGKISYSLYLIHLPVIFSSVHLLKGILPMWLIYLIAAAGTLAISSIMYILVEKPAVQLGKFLTRRDVEKNVAASSITARFNPHQ